MCIQDASVKQQVCVFSEPFWTVNQDCQQCSKTTVSRICIEVAARAQQNQHKMHFRGRQLGVTLSHLYAASKWGFQDGHANCAWTLVVAPASLSAYADCNTDCRPFAVCLQAEVSHLPFRWQVTDERLACGLCYTSGTTGNPKVCLYCSTSVLPLSILTSPGGEPGTSPASRAGLGQLTLCNAHGQALWWGLW